MTPEEYTQTLARIEAAKTNIESRRMDMAVTARVGPGSERHGAALLDYLMSVETLAEIARGLARQLAVGELSHVIVHGPDLMYGTVQVFDEHGREAK